MSIGEPENWRPVPGYPGNEVSDLGRVSLVNGEEREILPLTRQQRGYVTVSLRNESGARQFNVHTLVLTAFVGPRPEGMEACHFPDRDRSNNRLSNLRWDTHAANVADMLIHGTHYRGGGRLRIHSHLPEDPRRRKKRPVRKPARRPVRASRPVPDDLARAFIRLWMIGWTCERIARWAGRNVKTVRGIVNGTIRPDISKEFEVSEPSQGAAAG